MGFWIISGLVKITSWDLLQQWNSYGKVHHPWSFGDYLWMGRVWVGRDGVGKGGFGWALFGWSQMTLAWIVLAWIWCGGYEWGQQVRVGGWEANSICHYFNPQPNFNVCVSSYAAQMDGWWRMDWWLSIENCECCIFLTYFSNSVFTMFCLLWFSS